MTEQTITAQIMAELESDPIWGHEMDRQIGLEEKMRGMGIDRYWNTQAKNIDKRRESSSGPVHRLMNETIGFMTTGIETFINAASQGKAGRKHAAVTHMQKLEPNALALLTARTVLDGITRGDTIVRISTMVASMVEDEINYRLFKAYDKADFNRALSREKRVNGSSYRRMRISLKHLMDTKGIETEVWPQRTKLHVGSKLVEIMMETTGLVTKEERRVGVNKSVVYLVATTATMDWIQKESNRAALLTPVYLPTIIPPRPWTSPVDGGYWSNRVRSMPLVKTRSKEYLEELTNANMEGVYDAVNAMQHTAWKVNDQVLEVMRNLWDTSSLLGGIPSADELPEPTKPEYLAEEKPKELWTEDEMNQFKSWKRKAQETHTRNAKLKSLRLQFVKILTIGETFKDEGEIYFPYQLDFRGRAYAVPMFLNPQGSDVAKGLLTFANAVPLNDDNAVAWLAIHGSNCFGNDKDTLQGRVDWVLQNEAEILACAEDPYNNKFWSDADKPFVFLAFCFEWAGYKKHGLGYESHLPVQMDGSCNGLQNFSACLRDEIGGSAVNLTPHELPADIYNKVADKVKARLAQDVLSEDVAVATPARMWLEFGVNRKVCKRPVMTLAYGAREFGFKQQILEDTILPAKYDNEEASPFEGREWEAANYMGSVIWQSVSTVVVAAAAAMNWFQSAARLAAKEGLPVRWETPDGLTILQAYATLRTERIQVTFGSVRANWTIAVGETQGLDKQKQANSISPNWVHSMDASHMRATVRRSYREGVRSFSLIHDSYGTHAGNTDALAYYLREQFVEMYQEDVMDNFRKDLLTQLPPEVELPELPPKGTLDLALVMESDYFFA